MAGSLFSDTNQSDSSFIPITDYYNYDKTIDLNSEEYKQGIRDIFHIGEDFTDNNISLLSFSKTPVRNHSKPSSSLMENIVSTARQYVQVVPYKWSGTTPSNGFDCSGLLYYAFKQNGIDIPRSAAALESWGTKVDSLQDAKVGDIICTPGTGSSGKHVKIISKIIGNQIWCIEAKGKNYGIVEEPLTKTNNITTIRRYNGGMETPKNRGQKFTNRQEFINTMLYHYQRALQKAGISTDYAKILTAQDAHESAFGSSLAAKYNYGGITKGSANGKLLFRDFNSIQEFCDYKVKLLSNKRYNAFNYTSASNPYEFIKHVNDKGYEVPGSNYPKLVYNIYTKYVK